MVLKLTDLTHNFTQEIPKSKLYLYKYFSGKLQRKILLYYFNGGRERPYAFSERTGEKCSPAQICAVKKKIECLEKAMSQARANKDFSTVALLRSGKFVPVNLDN
jgi:hypothetical protein